MTTRQHDERQAMTTSDSTSTNPREKWAVTVEVPRSLPDEERDGLFALIADVVALWEPADRDGWDADVYAGPVAADLGDAGEREVSAWARVGEEDPLTLTGGSGTEMFCPAQIEDWRVCTRRENHPGPHVASDWSHDRRYETTEVRVTWLTLSGDDALAPLLAAIDATAGDRAGAVRAAVLDALGVEG